MFTFFFIHHREIRRIPELRNPPPPPPPAMLPLASSAPVAGVTLPSCICMPLTCRGGAGGRHRPVPQDLTWPWASSPQVPDPFLDDLRAVMTAAMTRGLPALQQSAVTEAVAAAAEALGAVLTPPEAQTLADALRGPIVTRLDRTAGAVDASVNVNASAAAQAVVASALFGPRAALVQQTIDSVAAQVWPGGPRRSSVARRMARGARRGPGKGGSSEGVLVMVLVPLGTCPGMAVRAQEP